MEQAKVHKDRTHTPAVLSAQSGWSPWHLLLISDGLVLGSSIFLGLGLRLNFLRGARKFEFLRLKSRGPSRLGLELF